MSADSRNTDNVPGGPMQSRRDGPADTFFALTPIEYRPLGQHFTEIELEKGFRSTFHHQLSKIDFSWSFVTAILSVAFVRQIKDLDPSSRTPLLADLLGSLVFSAAICSGSALFPAIYGSVRTPTLIAFRVWHQVALLRTRPELTPPDGATGAIYAVPPHTARGLALRLLAHCAFAGAASNGYQLLGLAQVLSAVLNIAHHLRKGMYTCGLPTEGGGEAAAARLYATVAGRLSATFGAVALPLTLAPSLGLAGAPSEWQWQCSALYIWSIVIFGCLAPLAVAVAVEESYRWGYLRERRTKALAPGLWWRAVHGVVCVAMGAAALWAALDGAEPWVAAAARAS